MPSIATSSSLSRQFPAGYNSRPNRPQTVTHPAHSKSPSARGWMPETVKLSAGCPAAGCRAP